MSESELLRASLGGSKEAFGAVVQRCQSLVCAIGDLGRSEGLVQETFIRARKTCGKSILFPSRQGPCDPQDEHPMQ